MSRRGLPASVQMRHDAHYVDELSASSRAIGKTIAIDAIEPNPEQPRTEFGDLTELTESIREKGVLEPLLVVRGPERGKYMIIAGERRWRASKLAGLKEVPCIEMDLDEKGVAEIALIENLQRKDLTVWEEADGLAALADKFGYTQGEIAKKISKSRTTVTELMTIAGLPQDIRQRCRAANITSKAGLLDIARQFDEAAMYEYLDELGGTPRQKRLRDARLQKEAKASKPRPPVRQGPVVASDKPFIYDSPSGDFQIFIGFAEGTDTGRSGILAALKEAFDHVKNGKPQGPK